MKQPGSRRYLFFPFFEDFVNHLKKTFHCVFLMILIIVTPFGRYGYAYYISVTVLCSGKPYVDQIYVGTECKVLQIAEGKASARAAPFALQARSSSLDGYEEAFASFRSGLGSQLGDSLVIIIQDRQEFMDLIPEGQDYLELLLNVVIELSVQTPLYVLPFGHNAVSSTMATLTFIGGSCFIESRSGAADHLIDHVEARIDYSGFFSDMPVGGGRKIIALPVRICKPLSEAESPALVIFGGRVSSQNSSSAEQFAQSSIGLRLLASKNLLTLYDGTPLSNIGISYAMVPFCSNPITAPLHLLLLE